MNGWARGTLAALAGLCAGLGLGFLVWGAWGRGPGFVRAYSDGARVRVASVIDGDTVVLEDGMHVRYRGCDTPEVYRFVRDPASLAEAASSRNRELVEGAWVTLRLPPAGAPALDAHGRLLADVCLADEEGGAPRSAGELLVREGLARADLQDVRGRAAGRLREAQAAAREAKLGVWGGKTEREGEGFVASRRGKCAHLPDCVYAKRIGPGNLMRFNTLEAALQTGRTPCPTCLADRLRAGGGKRAPGADAAPGVGDAEPSP